MSGRQGVLVQRETTHMFDGRGAAVELLHTLVIHRQLLGRKVPGQTKDGVGVRRPQSAIIQQHFLHAQLVAASRAGSQLAQPNDFNVVLALLLESAHHVESRFGRM